MTNDFLGKVALITGASRGIGQGIALELAEAGCDLLLTARDEAALAGVAQAAHAMGRKAEIHVADLTSKTAPESLVIKLERQFGRLDILINNAGTAQRRDFLALTDADWERGFGLKFFAHVRLCQAAWPLLKRNGGSVVAIAGIGARSPVADYMVGASVIGAELAFMKALADIGKRDGVQVNTVNPGSVDTDRFRHRLAIVMQRTGLDEAAAIEHYRQEVDVTRIGLPEDIAALVAFIASPRGRWLHGTAIDMDGGQVAPLRMSAYD